MKTAQELDIIRASIIGLVQNLLKREPDRLKITPNLIKEKLELVLKLDKEFAEYLDLTAIIDELIRRYSITTGDDLTLKSDVGHVPWLSADRKKDWRYWQRYREYSESKISITSTEAMNKSTDSILELLEDPNRQGSWDRRGLVVGHVQSGKTSNYTGLICKAADAGYKIIIVLAGLHNNLRSQTQIRLDEGFLGYKTSPNPDDIELVGVGKIDSDSKIRPNYATNRSEEGDFNTRVARNLGITPEQRPWLFVVKKNKLVLDKLFQWIKNHVANATDISGRKIVNNLPLLVIDDEADQASVDTGVQIFTEDGQPDAEHEPKVINSLIRKILHSFTRSAYVGYTATPFANIFIHEKGSTNEEGPDLFPSSFIINLAAASNYVGPSKIFLENGLGENGANLPLARAIQDPIVEQEKTGWMPKNHKSSHDPISNGHKDLPTSLIEAIDSFILVCAARRLRGHEREHSSMLIHVTRFNNVQQVVFKQVEEHFRVLSQKIQRGIGSSAILERLNKLWVSDFMPTTNLVRNIQAGDVPTTDHDWDSIAESLPIVVSDIKVKVINGTAKDALDYEDHKATGLKVIAIGGDKLSRGLTLEGLSISYFLRASKMYDTLMQMGRWFGYRPGYLDLCRLFLTSELKQWFMHIASAAEELREEFELMQSIGGTPKDYGLKVQSHKILLVTSRLKMRSARTLSLSFSGGICETVTFFRDSKTLQSNLDAMSRFVESLGSPKENQQIVVNRNASRLTWDGYLWNKIGASEVLRFISEYRTHEKAISVNSAQIAEFISMMNQEAELNQWTVALIGGGKGDSHTFLNGINVQMLERGSNSSTDDKGRQTYSIGRLLSSRDESIDLSEPQWNAALELTRIAKKNQDIDTPSGPIMRKIRGEGAVGVPPQPEKGLLLLYLIDPRREWTGIEGGAPPISAFGVVFPTSKSGKKIEYKINNVLWEQEYALGE